MSLLSVVVDELGAHGTPFAVIGAAALAVRGVSRATSDFDLFAIDPQCLSESYWTAHPDLAGMEIRRGDSDDPLAGVVRFGSAPGSLDLVIGWGGWQAGVIGRATSVRLEGLDLPVVSAPDLILLKLYAGGPQDAWDIGRLLAISGAATAEIVREVDPAVAQLPSRARRLWQRVKEAPEAD